VVDSEDQIIVAAETTSAANDKEQAVPMAQAALGVIRCQFIFSWRNPVSVYLFA
jgi:hypothetical protein